MKRVLYTGSFDPITMGHMNIVDQASEIFDEVLIAVLVNSNKKNYLFTTEERLELIKEIYKDRDNVKVITSDKAAVDVVIENDCVAIVRGLRSLSDYADEVTNCLANKAASNNEVNTICFFADTQYQFVSSSMVKEMFKYDKDITNFVAPVVKNKMLMKKR